MEFRDDGTMILGNNKSTGIGTVMIIPGINESALMDMGDLGFLTGKALIAYEKGKALKK